MSKDQAVAHILEFEPAWQAEIQEDWQRLMEIAVWGELKSSNIGALPKLRKRLLDVGEKWRSLFNDRGWIPRPRERLKNALGSALSLHDSTALLERAAKDIEGGADYAEFSQLLIKLNETVVGPLREKENTWATMLDAVNREGLGEDLGE